ncbi:MAG: PrgI family protein [Candidatus Parcubacteria bacterium]|nr:PrgI family protein [Candidatus Parcubacteria bacterium]
MQHTIPQFIEHEAKIVGPFTFKQFIYLAVAAAIALVLYVSFGMSALFIIGSVIAGVIALALALLKVEGRSLPDLIKNIILFFSASKIFLWKRQDFKIIKTEIKKPAVNMAKAKEGMAENKKTLPVTSKSKLSDLNMKIETKK